MQRRKYGQDFKEKLTKEALETDNASVVARKYDINPTVLNRWIRQRKKQPEKELQKKALFSYQNLYQEPEDLKSARKQIQQLKVIIGKKELKIELLKKRIYSDSQDRNSTIVYKLWL